MNATATAHFTITIPAATTSASSRHAAFVSSATQSIVIALSSVNGAAYTGAAATIASNLTSSNPNCSGTPLTCSLAAPGAPGTDTFTVTTYDALQTSASPSAPAGNLLAQATISITILANATNAVALVLNGVPASVAIAGLPNGTAGTAFAAHAFVVAVKDASGRTIVGVYANPVTLADSDVSGATSIATSGSDSPPAGQLLSSNDVAALSYSGLAVVPMMIGATAAGATSSSASFTPALQPILTTAPLNVTIPELALTGLNGTRAFTASEAGWTNPPYNKSLTVTTPSGCSGIGTVSPASGTAFTTTVVGSPVVGTCTLTLSDFSSGSTSAMTLAYVTGTQTYTSLTAQTYTVPFGVTQATIVAAGAQGAGAEGGSVTATIPVTPGELLAVYVGGANVGGTGGFNGGGNSGGNGCNSGGGGASDVRQGGGLLSNRVVVAGGGGGGGCDDGYGGGLGGVGGYFIHLHDGGDVTTAGGGHGGAGADLANAGAGGGGGVGAFNGGAGGSGTPGIGGTGGVGGGGAFAGLGGSGGGAGYFGGGGGGGGAGAASPVAGIGGGGGGGGTSFAEASATNVAHTWGVQSGNGNVVISW